MKCRVEWCDQEAKRVPECPNHRKNMLRALARGRVFDPLPYHLPTHEECNNGDGTASVPLWNRYNQKVGETLIDIEDLERVLAVGRWHITVRSYAGAKHHGKQITMHRFIMNTPKGMDTDHINRNGFDNRKSNLRIVTHRENQANLSVRKGSNYRGVSFDRRSKQNPWIAEVTYMGKHHWIGKFATEEAAGEAAREWRLANMNGATD